MPDMIFPSNEKPLSGDRIFFSTVYIMPANIITRGLFTRLKCRKVFFFVDASFGTCMASDKMPQLISPSDIFQKAEPLPQKLSQHATMQIAKESVFRTQTNGWQRIISNENIIFQEGQFASAGIVYLLRDERLIETYSGNTADTGTIFNLMFAKND
ncbi:MAG: hypothetical protein Q4E17_04740 [Synergistes sp.]|nr:hypothetical protein [Synergistes sp.]